jgi:GNAT superfamily N-acetyltransferase
VDRPTIEIRFVERAEASAVARLAQEVHAFHSAALPELFQPPTTIVVTPADIERLATQPGQLLLVAVRAGEIVGYAHAEVQEVPATRLKRASAILHLHAMGVTAAHRGAGVGRALLAAIRDAAAARGLAGVSLEVYAFNAAARAFYEREGFAPLRALLVSPAPARGG